MLHATGRVNTDDGMSSEPESPPPSLPEAELADTVAAEIHADRPRRDNQRPFPNSHD